MTNGTAVAYSRLAAIGALLVLLGIFACRPAWSPDGKRLLYPVQAEPQRIAVAVYDRDTGVASLLATTPVGNNLVAMTWSADGKTAIVVTGNERADALAITAHAMPANGEPKVLTLACRGSTSDVFMIPPVVIGEHLFLSVDGIVRLGLTSGEELRRPAEHRSLLVFPRGPGLAYLQIEKGDRETDWELGTVDPGTLELTPLFKAPEDQGWKPMAMPAFDRALSRVALPVRRGEDEHELAILVFRDGKLETVLPMGDDRDVDLGNVTWANDQVMLLISLCRHGEGELPEAWGLCELLISGSVIRETTIVRSRRGNEAGHFPMALSPDGRTAAFSTAMMQQVGPDEHGLYLIDLASQKRTVTRVPFPRK